METIPEPKSDHSKCATLQTFWCCIFVLFSLPAIAGDPVVSLLTSQDPLVNPFWQDPYLFLVSPKTGMMFKYDEKGNTSNIVNTSIVDVMSMSFIVPIKGKAGHFVAGTESSVQIFYWNLTTPESEREPIKKFLSSISFGADDPGRMVIGQTDCRGRLWVGTENHRVYRVMPDGTVTVQLSDIGIPVGFAWNSDGSQFYRSDLDNGKIWLHDFNLDTGDVSINGTVFFDFDMENITDGYPGNMAMDMDDNLWVPCTGTRNVVKIDHKTRKVITTVTIPDETRQIISISFGLTKLDTLFVTTAYILNSATGLYKVNGTGSIGQKPEPFDLI